MLIKRIVFIYVSLLSLFQMQAQKIYSAANEVNFEHFSTEDGLAGHNLYNIYQDKNGFLWIPSAQGLSKFDGLHFKNFTKKDGLPIDFIGSVIMDKNNVLWVGTHAGIVLYKNQKFIAFDSTTKVPTWLTWSFYEDADKTIWAGTGNGMYHLNPDNLKNPIIKSYKMVPDNFATQNNIRSITRNLKGDLLAGTDAGIYILQKDTFLKYGNYDGRAYSIVQINDSTEWTCGWDSPVNELINGIHKNTINLGSPIMAISKTINNEIWLASWDKGVFKYDGDSFIQYNHEQGLSSNSFWGINSDKEGNVWFSSWGEGLFKYSGEHFTKITDKSGLIGNVVNGIHKAPDGKIWFSTENGISYVDTKNNNKKKSFKELDGKELSKIICSIVTPDNEFLAFGYIGFGYKIKDDKLSIEPKNTGFSAIIDSKGDLLVGTEAAGVFRYNKGDSVANYAVKGKVFKRFHINYVQSIYEDNKNNLWFENTYFGINYFNGKKTINFSSVNGFFDEPGNSVTSDNKGNYWIAVSGRGVYKCTLPNDTTLLVKDSIMVSNGLPSDNVTSVQINKGKLYICSSGGLSILDLKLYELNHSKILSNYNKSDGFVSSQCSIAFFNENGSAWLKTDKGAFLYDPHYERKVIAETNTHILGIKLFLSEVNWRDYADSLNEEGLPNNLTLNYKNNHLTFSYIGICLTSPLKVKYKYKIEGLDKNWSPETTLQQAVYSNIPPGTYTFMVIASNNKGVWNQQPTTFVFIITPPFWKTNWFIALVTLSVIALAYLYITAREKKLKIDKQILEGKVKERTEELKQTLEIVEEKQKEIVDSINYAQRIQSAYLPPEETFYRAFKDAFLLFKPKDIVSGDFYWFYMLNGDVNSNIVFCAVADCTGHGVPGALMSVICCNALNEAVVTQGISDTDKILNETRRLVKRNLKSDKYSGQKDGMDIALIKLNTKTGELWYSGAYNPIWIVSNGELIELQADKQPIGIHEKETDFKTAFTQLKKQDVVYLFSDGFADQFGGIKGKKFKYKSLAEQMVKNQHKPMQEQKQTLIETFENWRGNLEQVDDVCIIGIRYNANE